MTCFFPQAGGVHNLKIEPKHLVPRVRCLCGAGNVGHNVALLTKIVLMNVLLTLGLPTLLATPTLHSGIGGNAALLRPEFSVP